MEKTAADEALVYVAQFKENYPKDGALHRTACAQAKKRLLELLDQNPGDIDLIFACRALLNYVHTYEKENT